MKSHSQSGDGTKDLDQELKLLLGVLPLRLDLLLSEDSKSSRNLKGQETVEQERASNTGDDRLKHEMGKGQALSNIPPKPTGTIHWPFLSQTPGSSSGEKRWTLSHSTSGILTMLRLRQDSVSSSHSRLKDQKVTRTLSKLYPFLAGSTKHPGSKGESSGHTESWQKGSMTKQKGMGWWNSDGSLQA